MKKRYAVILHTDRGTRMSYHTFSNVARAVGYANELEIGALKLGWRAEVVELRPVEKARGARA